MLPSMEKIVGTIETQDVIDNIRGSWDTGLEFGY